MAETVKTRAALLAEMADGGNNTAEEVRNGILSMYQHTEYVIGDGAANHTTSSGTFVDVDAAYSIAVPAAAGDILKLEFSCIIFTNAALGVAYVVFEVAGNLVNPQFQFASAAQGGANVSAMLPCLTFHEVAAGDISGGNVTVTPQWKEEGGDDTATMLNTTSEQRRPVFSVTNLGPQA